MGASRAPQRAAAALVGLTARSPASDPSRALTEAEIASRSPPLRTSAPPPPWSVSRRRRRRSGRRRPCRFSLSLPPRPAITSSPAVSDQDVVCPLSANDRDVGAHRRRSVPRFDAPGAEASRAGSDRYLASNGGRCSRKSPTLWATAPAVRPGVELKRLAARRSPGTARPPSGADPSITGSVNGVIAVRQVNPDLDPRWGRVDGSELNRARVDRHGVGAAQPAAVGDRQRDRERGRVIVVGAGNDPLVTHRRRI